MTEPGEPPQPSRELGAPVRPTRPALPGLYGILDAAADLVRPRLGPVGRMSALALTLSGRSVAATERAALGILQSRLQAVAPTVGEMPAPRRLGTAASEDPRRVMADLLTRGLQQNTATGHRDHELAVLRRLVPDEARIIAALAEEKAAPPVVHVYPRGGKEPILANASLVGRLAALTLPSRTPTYVTHLLALGLVETGPEDQSNQEGYELLLADRDVRAALKRGELGKLPARVQRLTLRLTPLGRDLWEHTRPTGGDA